MIKPCSVIYFPCTGGNFIRFCLSLSKETVPYYHKPLGTCSDQEILEIKSMPVDKRKKLVRFKSLEDFKRYHNEKDDIFTPDFYYDNPLMDSNFDWSIVPNHTSNYQDRLPYLKKIVWLELDWKKYGHWVENSFQYFRRYAYNFSPTCCVTDHQYTQAATIKSLPITEILSMTKVLEGVDGFVQEYIKICTTLSITPELDCATQYYQEWRSLRVDPFI